MPLPVRIVVEDMIAEARRDGDRKRLEKLREWRSELKRSGRWNTAYASWNSLVPIEPDAARKRKHKGRKGMGKSK